MLSDNINHRIEIEPLDI